MARQPMYQQIADSIRQEIRDGKLSRGQQLPTEVELRDVYSASRNTIRDAVKLLVSQGLVETRPGQGTFVTAAVIPFVTMLTAADPETGFGGGEGATYLDAIHDYPRRPEYSPIKVEVQPPPEPVRLRLRLPEGQQTILRHQKRLIDDAPWSMQTSFYPLTFVTDDKATDLLLASDIRSGTVAYLAAFGHRQKGYRDWVTGRSPTEDEQNFFRIGPETTVFEIFRTAFDQANVPIRVTVTVFPADRNQLIVDVGDDLPAPEYNVRETGDPEW
jgi:GntR family transcriptional regulator